MWPVIIKTHPMIRDRSICRSERRQYGIESDIKYVKYGIEFDIKYVKYGIEVDIKYVIKYGIKVHRMYYNDHKYHNTWAYN